MRYMLSLHTCLIVVIWGWAFRFVSLREQWLGLVRILKWSVIVDQRKEPRHPSHPPSIIRNQSGDVETSQGVNKRSQEPRWQTL